MIYIIPKDAEHEEKLPNNADVYTLDASEKTYTRNEVLKMIDEIRKGTGTNETTNQSEN